MTPFEIDLAKALGQVSGWVGARFMDSIERIAKNAPEQDLSLRQRHYMEIMAWRYRRQLPRDLVPERKPLPMPRAAPTPRQPKAKPLVKQAEPHPDLFSLSLSSQLSGGGNGHG